MPPPRYCRWFASRNPTAGGRILKCRYGSLCRGGVHLTGDEVETISAARPGEKKEPVPCRNCKGLGKIRYSIIGLTDQTIDKSEVVCWSCNGNGLIMGDPVREMVLSIYNRASSRDFCDCEDDPGYRYHRDGNHPRVDKHCYTCRRCNGITQIG